MVRKTKEEALVTRGRIIDAAERLFQVQGVSGTSLHDIALAAGVTRGAIYWHFKDKSDLFNAMMDRVCLPMEEESSARLDRPDDATPLLTLREHLVGILEGVAGDEQVRRVFEIATHKIEYVDELSAVRERHLQIRRDYVAVLERTLRAAQRHGHLVRAPSARLMAIGLHALLSGLIENWVLDPADFVLVPAGRQAIDAYLAGLTPQPRADA